MFNPKPWLIIVLVALIGCEPKEREYAHWTPRPAAMTVPTAAPVVVAGAPEKPGVPNEPVPCACEVPTCDGKPVYTGDCAGARVQMGVNAEYSVWSSGELILSAVGQPPQWTPQLFTPGDVQARAYLTGSGSYFNGVPAAFDLATSCGSDRCVVDPKGALSYALLPKASDALGRTYVIKIVDSTPTPGHVEILPAADELIDLKKASYSILDGDAVHLWSTGQYWLVLEHYRP